MTNEFPIEETKKIRIRLASDESGWAELLTEDVAIILNNSTHGTVSIGDTCRVEKIEGIYHIKSILNKRYKHLVTLLYPNPGACSILEAIIDHLGGETERFIAPTEKSPGHLAVAYNGDFINLHKLAESLGMPQGENEEKEGE
jgi:hypothetical protein